MRYSKILIPIFDEFCACQLTTETLEDFKKFIERGAIRDSIEVTFLSNQKGYITPKKVSFKWNPYGNDYAKTITVYLNQWFLYNNEDMDYYQIWDNQNWLLGAYSYEIED